MDSSSGESSDEETRQALTLSLAQAEYEDADLQTAIAMSMDEDPFEEAVRMSLSQAEAQRREQQELDQALELSLLHSDLSCSSPSLPAPLTRTTDGVMVADPQLLRLMVQEIVSTDKVISDIVTQHIDILIQDFMRELDQSDECESQVQAESRGESMVMVDSPSAPSQSPGLEVEEITSVVSRGRQVLLPPSGDIRKPVFEVGDEVYALYDEGPDSRFQPALVKRWTLDSHDHDTESTASAPGYEVVFETDNDSGIRLREVTSGRIALRNKPTLMLKIGTHVMTTNNYKSGMVAELAKVTNSGRYLIFYENGEAGYVSPDNVRLVGDAKFHCDDYDLPVEYSQFLKDYLKSYPERRMVRPNLKSHVEIRNFVTGSWEKALVKDTDCSLMTIRFPSSNHKETLYRGSHRIKEIFDSLMQRRSTPCRSTRAMRSTGIMHASIQRIRSNISRRPQSDYLTIHYSRDDEAEGRMITGVSSQENAQPSTGHHTVSFLKTGQALLRPERLQVHECSSLCTRTLVTDVSLFRGHNPFTFPMFAGWSRLIFDTSIPSNGKSVVYVAPCGRSLCTIDDLDSYLVQTHSPLDIMFFSMDPELEIFRSITASQHQCVWYEEDLSHGQEKQPISIVNFLDEERLDPRFRYRSQRFPGPGVHLPLDPDFLSCCDCTDNCADPLSCACQQLTSEGFEVIPGLAEVSRVRGYKNKRLDGNIPFGIYECNSRCSCNAHCPTRVVQHGVQVLLQVFKTSRKGWGVRALHDIPSGTFLTVYAAQILNDESADLCGRTLGDEYFANLDFIDCAEATKEAYEDECPFSQDEDADLDSESDSGGDEDSEENENQDMSYRDASDDEDYVAPVPLPARTVPCLPAVQEPSGDREPRRTRPQVALKRVRSDVAPSSVCTASVVGMDEESVRVESQDGEVRRPFRSFFGGSNAYILDAMCEGNVGRFLNHSCSPTAFAQNVFFETHDLRFPTVAFFASRNIYALEEITWDYQYEVDSVPGKKLYCYCRSAGCRGRLI